MNKTIAERRLITDVKSNKCIKELSALGDATWSDIDTDISM